MKFLWREEFLTYNLSLFTHFTYCILMRLPAGIFFRISSMILSLSTANSAEETFLPSLGSLILPAETFEDAGGRQAKGCQRERRGAF